MSAHVGKGAWQAPGGSLTAGKKSPRVYWPCSPEIKVGLLPSLKQPVLGSTLPVGLSACCAPRATRLRAQTDFRARAAHGSLAEQRAPQAKLLTSLGALNPVPSSL